MYLKIIQLILIIFKLSSHSCSDIQTNQHFLIQNTISSLKLIKIEVNKINKEILQKTTVEHFFDYLMSENQNKTPTNTLELYFEFKINSTNFTLFLSSYEDDCGKKTLNQKYYYIKSKRLFTKIQKIEIKEEFKDKYRRGILICRKVRKNTFKVMKIKPLFHNKLNFQPLNKTEKNILKNNKENEGEDKLTKVEWNLNEQKKEFYIEICINFKNKGNYLILLNEGNFTANSLQLFLKNKKGGQSCVNETFKISFEEEIKIINELKKRICIFLIKIEEREDYKNELFINNWDLFIKYFQQIGSHFAVILPLIDDGIYEFDEEKQIKYNFKNSSNILKNNLIPREIGKMSKNKFFIKEDWQKWFYFEGEYFFMNENGKAINVLEEEEEEEH